MDFLVFSYKYQKTISLTLPSVFNDTKIGEVPANADICSIVNCFGVRNNGQKWVIPNYYTSDDIADVYIANNNDISARAKGLFVSMPIYLTIQYTKTT